MFGPDFRLALGGVLRILDALADMLDGALQPRHKRQA
jgi:hypothetical protein